MHVLRSCPVTNCSVPWRQHVLLGGVGCDGDGAGVGAVVGAGEAARERGLRDTVTAQFGEESVEGWEDGGVVCHSRMEICVPLKVHVVEDVEGELGLLASVFGVEKVVEPHFFAEGDQPLCCVVVRACQEGLQHCKVLALHDALCPCGRCGGFEGNKGSLEIGELSGAMAGE
eukprot:4510579-Ditylum_brightwellii.AAC.1